MQTNRIRLIIVILLLTLIQLMINNGGIIYLDCVGVVLIALLINGQYTLQMLIFTALFADLIGHWYLGTHLLAAILSSFITSPLVNFYRICNPIQKATLTSMLYAFALGIVAIVGLLTHNVILSWGGFFLNILVICPLILSLLSYFVFKPCSDIIY